MKRKEAEYTNVMVMNDKKPQNRLLIFTPTTGLVRIEWVRARYGQVVPTNWSHMEFGWGYSEFIPVQYQLADAQNMMAKYVVEGDYEWVLSIEHDNILPPDAFVRMNEYMIRGDTPIVSAIYFTKSNPPEPILYRGRGNGHFRDWKMGDKVWVDGVPFGLTLIHSSIIRAAWKESPEYMVGTMLTRRVFDNTPSMYFDPDAGGFVSVSGTTDLVWCDRIMKDKLFEKAGWPEFQKKEFPFLVDTNIFVKHITMDGKVSPDSFGGIPSEYIKHG